ncbi:DExH-box ATP-dependent RNA helicase DExH6 isoform X1 [Cucurbita pepo subsp. pepo]|uniref:DExH-box ATP-dependent RNA helicase DExH6 isoform X1 n=1 Tax=Cucurbita pepo subsp. pepo TaxID=3664 RepID=UPI000C9D7336|nr:DExH-box ATP-dependent RNA helicase DExH6 isoform X1 [Cucurbita pepo subsp. pepo]XP_023512690.1 DExH-box ATP-dependent RNA helicase DExH6 isoform X1 [Cucurbita pepo subsp. pepo]
MAKKKQKKGEQKPKPKAFADADSEITQALERFCLSNDEVFTFEADLSKRERALVHEECRKMGLTSKSYGRGDQRRVSIYKSKPQKDTMKFSEKTKSVLDDLFSSYPPDDGELGKETIGKSKKKAHKPSRKKDDIFWRPSMNKEEIMKKVESYTTRVKSVANLKKISGDRSKLPIASFQDVITSTVESHQVVLISGETGCGKTTQVPQFLLDYMWGKGEACKIICTQPRRISATSVSERISYERGENVGSDVGYKIRLESKGGRHSSIVLCTNGILLRVLISEGLGKLTTEASEKSRKNVVSDLTHIIVDEVHERDRYSDFILAILRDLLPTYPHLRLILMSATIDAERFSKYFGGCPIISVPGFTFPVKNFYLEDVLSIVKSSEENHLDDSTVGASDEETELTEEDKLSLDEAIHLAWLNDEFDPLLELVASEGSSQIFNYQHSVTGLSPLMVLAGKGRVSDVCMLLSFGAMCELQAKDGMTALEMAERGEHKETAEAIRKHLESSMSNSKEEQRLIGKYLARNSNSVDVALIDLLLGKICLDSKEGAILVFLPGWDDISKTRERLSINPIFKDASKFLIISLHSMVPSKEQKKVFKRPPPGCRKIILSTNIAETAITIDDVVYVIDSGWMKEKSYDPYSNVSTFQSSWISKASAKQREGRAGRCQPGICYHLYSKFRASSLPDFQVPEIKRMPIEELCLQVKLLDPNCRIEDFLQKTLDPPVFDTIRNAILVLQDIGALSHDEKLTELGEKLGSLPVHPVTSKMLIFAILMNCLEPALTLACASDYKDPFTLPMLPSERKKAAAAKAELASLYGGHSDQLAVVAAFDCWKNAKRRGQEARFCSKYHISPSTMSMLFGMRRQLEMELVQNGFIPEDISTCSLNARDPGILHAVLVAGLYPMVGRLLPPQKKGKRAVVETGSGGRVLLHRQSLNFELSHKLTDYCPLIVYDEITRGDGGTHIRNCTVVGPLPLLMVAKEIAVAPAKENDNGKGDIVNDTDGNDEAGVVETVEDKMDIENKPNEQPEEMIMSSPDNSVTVVVDRWLYFWSKALDIAQLYCLRERLSAAILFKVKHPNKILPPVLGASMHALACILSYDGLTGISLESVEMLTSMVDATEISNFVPGRSNETHKKVSSFHRSLSNYNDFTVPESSGTSNLNHPFSQNFLPPPDFRAANPSDPSSPNFRAFPNSVYARSTLQPHREQEHPQPAKPFQDQNATQQQHAPEHKTRKQRKSRRERKAAQQQKHPQLQKPPSGEPSLNGYGLSTYGPYGLRGISLKRPRGNGAG